MLQTKLENSSICKLLQTVCNHKIYIFSCHLFSMFTKQYLMKVPDCCAYISFEETVKIVNERVDLGNLYDGRRVSLEKDKTGHIIGIQVE